jgi:hypothetical protein
MDLRTDRVGLLVEQLTESVDISKERMAGMTDDEFGWEPYEGMWSIRRRADVVTPNAYGPGDYALDFDRSVGRSEPGPLTTTAWRIGHLISGFAGRWEWTFGDRRTAPGDVVEFSPHSVAMLDRLWRETARWVASVETLTAEQLEVPGFGQYPLGLDPEVPFIGIVWWTNREFIHHMAEAALLRDLYLRREERSGPQIGVT